MITYTIVGAGWRSEFYLRIAALMPKTFSVGGILVRNPAKRARLSEKYGVKICTSLEELLAIDCDFVVSCVSKGSIKETLKTLAASGVPVLSETPVADEDIGGRIQVAEQFRFAPRNCAYKAIIDSGILGAVHQVQLSCCHDYHAASLIRFFLDTGFELPQVTAVTLPDPVMRYNGRGGLLASPAAVQAEESIRILRFRDKTAVYDFSREQYFSDIRASRIVIRGERGEIVDNTCTYLEGGIPQRFTLHRSTCGSEENLDGFSLLRITGNGNVLYKNPFPGARLSDEEIAVATCLVKMKAYADGEDAFYSVKDAAFDCRLLQD